ncbi:hypothetical protein GALMADRAFT_154100 [Galerina marginata CBS 339.88]|uniref:F-box domain-containing protein n=1 Tax=Galerina marginata (strain CBS 339.88) TaxID=685588 RepID=A0A067TJG4_GALM3|nr:hypothetical protein GALMADRAFT_154100 [Galerina marginata CBS 339.88]
MEDSSVAQDGAVDPSRLQHEILALKMENEDLKDEITDLRQELDACKKTLREISGLRKPFSQPPSEVLRMIFERTIPPHFLLDSSASFGLNSLFCQVLKQKVSIVNVCRTWYSVGLPFLYGNISIRRVHQLLDLLRSLVNSTTALNLKEMIRTVDIYCVVPQWYGQQFEKQLKVLFELCPRISSCAFRSPFRALPTSPLAAVVPQLTNLVLNGGIKLAMLQVILQLVSPHVISLSFHIPEHEETSTSPTDQNFPHLEDISLWVTKPAARILGELSSVWKMPHLDSLTFHLQKHGQANYPTEILKHFCDAHGAGLRYLHIIDLTFLTCCRRSSNGYDIYIPDLSKSCPTLEHIVLSPMIGLPIAHEHLKWVDIWAPAAIGFRPKKLRKKIKKANLPALKGVRILPFYLHDAYSCNLPKFTPPNSVSTPADVFECMFLGFGIRHNVKEILYLQPQWSVDGTSEDSENSSDSESDEDQGSDESYGESTDGGDSVEETDNDSDREYVPNTPDSDSDSEFSESATDWVLGSDDNPLADTDVEMDDLETDFPWLENIS